MNELYKRCGKMIMTERVSTMLICIHGVRKGEMYGEIFNCYMEKSILFKGFCDLILKLDEMCDWIGTPHPSTEPRFLNQKEKARYHERTETNNHVPRIAKIRLLDTSIMLSKAVKARDSLLIQIEYRQHSSMQGTITGRMTDKKPVRFRSALELMRMLNESVGTIEEKN